MIADTVASDALMKTQSLRLPVIAPRRAKIPTKIMKILWLISSTHRGQCQSAQDEFVSLIRRL